MGDMQDGAYHVGNLLNGALDAVETVDCVLPDGQHVNAALVNGEDGVTVQISGTVKVDDICARCGDPVQIEVRLNGEVVEAELVNGKVDLTAMAADEVELARPPLAYCKKCQKKNN